MKSSVFIYLFIYCRCVYERTTIVNPTLMTFVTSAIWHGFYPGYFFNFIYFAITLMAARKVINTMVIRVMASLIPICLCTDEESAPCSLSGGTCCEDELWCCHLASVYLLQGSWCALSRTHVYWPVHALLEVRRVSSKWCWGQLGVGVSNDDEPIYSGLSFRFCCFLALFGQTLWMVYIGLQFNLLVAPIQGGKLWSGFYFALYKFKVGPGCLKKWKL